MNREMLKWGEVIEQEAIRLWKEEGLPAMFSFLKETVDLSDGEIEEVVEVWREGKSSYPYEKLLSKVMWSSTIK